ncbi:MAG: DUF4160 domain-containing protein [Candidatus Brachytrichaceae bacterium NZ_4S206]
MPTILRVKGYRFFFNSREETRRHVHVSTADGTAKFWLEPLIALAYYYNLSSKELAEAEEIIREYADDFRAAWDKHFGQ